LILKDQSDPHTDEEKAIAAGKQMLDPSKATKYLDQIQCSSMGIIEAFKKQQNTVVSSLLVQSGLYITKIYFQRSTIGAKKNLKNFLPNGSLHAINLLMKPRNLSFRVSSVTFTFNHC